LNEYELDLLRQRSVEARRAKAQRGELLVAAPVGFLKTSAPRLEKDPDRRIQEAIELVFRKFSELGSVRQTLSWLLEHGLQLLARSVSGEITWRRPSYGVLYRMLTNPNYGGAYAYGKTEDGPAESGAGWNRTARMRRTTSLLIGIPKARAICSIRGQPQVGFRCFMSTTAAIASWLGPFGPGFFRTVGENSRRYFRFVSAR
jgi:hypothetical protein